MSKTSVKIERIISDCNCCRYGKRFIEVDGNTDYVIICNFPSKSDRFVVSSSSNRIHPNVEIPANCPLENYSGTQSVRDEE